MNKPALFFFLWHGLSFLSTGIMHWARLCCCWSRGCFVCCQYCGPRCCSLRWAGASGSPVCRLSHLLSTQREWRTENTHVNDGQKRATSGWMKAMKWHLNGSGKQALFNPTLQQVFPLYDINLGSDNIPTLLCISYLGFGHSVEPTVYYKYINLLI